MKLFAPVFLTISAAALAIAPALDTVNLTRKYKSDEDNTYTIKVKAASEGQDIEASADVHMKVNKLLDNGNAKILCNLQNVKVLMGGQPMDLQSSDFDAEWNTMALPDRLITQEIEWMYTLTAIASVLPGKEIEVGKDFEIDWANADKSSKVKGKGKLVEVADLDGTKAAKVEYELEVFPQGEDTPGTIKSTSYFSPEDGKLVKCDGTVKVGNDNMTLNFSASKAK